MIKKNTLFEDYKRIFKSSSNAWKSNMLAIFEDQEYNITINNPISLPYPMEDGKLKLEPGDYQVELSPDKVNYIWTNPATQERVVFPVELIDEPETPPADTGEEPFPSPEGGDVGSQEVNPLAPQETDFNLTSAT